MAPKYSEYFTGSAPPILYSWSYSPIRCSAPLYSRSSSLIGSAYHFLYISFCFGLKKHLRTWLRCVNIIYNISDFSLTFRWFRPECLGSSQARIRTEWRIDLFKNVIKWLDEDGPLGSYDICAEQNVSFVNETKWYENWSKLKVWV